ARRSACPGCRRRTGASRRSGCTCRTIRACRCWRTSGGCFPSPCGVNSEAPARRGRTEDCMNPTHCFARLCLLLASALPLPALAAAGLVQFAAGDVQMRRGELLAAVARGALLDSGDTVLTGATGRAQIRFTDGGLVSLYPGSQFTITRYVDS